ncbi:MAG TPA: ABC transporter ATP-binding protein [Candidatus Methylomirabilis sp.]|nr:ABC transporter ATP-binding protein [Candidatus Methylomirabilis sp.]
MSGAAVLELAHVNTFRGPAHVLRDISLAVGDRESVCLVGRNGAGKTTTIDSIMGLLPVRSGTVRLKGADITRVPTHRRALAGIGYSPEDAGIFPDLTVAENFRISQSLARAAGEGAAPPGDGIDPRVLALFPEIANFTQRRGLFLSGGQKKMVAIGRAMTLSPSILLLDEPFEGLAPVVVSRFIDAVTRIKDMGISLLIAESNLMTASRVADRLYAIDRGEIIFQGEPRRAFEDVEVMKTIRG